MSDRRKPPGRVPDIPPTSGGDRPRWSVMIPTYNCAEMLGRTLHTVLDQDPGPTRMQVEVIDDHSTADRPDEVVAAVGGGRVDFFRQVHNVGIARNLTTCVTRSRGELVHVLHGDDIVRPGFYEAVEAAFGAHPDVGAVVVGSEDIDEHGNHLLTNELLRDRPGVLDDAYHQMFEWNPLRAPGIVVRRSVYERIGGYRENLRFCADWDMWKRLLVGTTVFYDPAVLVGYRVHAASDTARLASSPAQLREMIDAVRLAHGYLPLGQSRAWTRKFYGTVRRWAVQELRTAGPQRDPVAAHFAGLAVECIVRQQWDRLCSVPRRQGW